MSRPTAAIALACALGALAACTGTPSGAGGASPAPSKAPSATRSASPSPKASGNGTSSPAPGASASAAATAVATPSAPASYTPGAKVWIDGREHLSDNPKITRFEYGGGGDVITLDAGFLDGQWTNMTFSFQKELGTLQAGFPRTELLGWPMGLRGTINTLTYPTEIVGLRLDATSPRLQGVAESYGTPTRVGQGSGGPKIRMEFDVAFPSPRPT